MIKFCNIFPLYGSPTLSIPVEIQLFLLIGKIAGKHTSGNIDTNVSLPSLRDKYIAFPYVFLSHTTLPPFAPRENSRNFLVASRLVSLGDGYLFITEVSVVGLLCNEIKLKKKTKCKAIRGIVSLIYSIKWKSRLEEMLSVCQVITYEN